MAILVCGGAGYIGSHIVCELIRKHYDVVVIDNLSTGYRKLVHSKAKFYFGNISSTNILKRIFTENHIEAVIDLAASSVVSESIKNPIKYYSNNCSASLNLFKTMFEHNINKIVFSSSAAVYGTPSHLPITEESSLKPINAYGETKLVIENMLNWFHKAYHLRYVILRYFNVAGADKIEKIGEMHNPETHLIPIVLQSVLNKTIVKVYGDDHPTHDGTCIRDYIHVNDLATAHILALEALLYDKNTQAKIYNLGNSIGFSVLDIINMIETVTHIKVNYEIADKRSYDPAILIADSNKIRNELGWRPVLCDLKTIINSAWNWHKQCHLNK
jgi:UDP-glucose 4-epimerase